MKNFRNLLLAGAFLTSSLIYSQESDLSKGDVLKIASPSAYSYNHINFPKANFIIKKGRIADYKALQGVEVIVDEVTERNGDLVVLLKRKDGKKFFGLQRTVTANFDGAVKAGEITRING